MKLKQLAVATAMAAATLGAGTAQALPLYADIVVLMDESGSMAGEQQWIRNQISVLDSGLIAAGVGTGGTNRYGLIGFGASGAPGPADLRGFDVAVTGQPNNTSDTYPGTFGTVSQFQTAAFNLEATGGFEDGYAAIKLANSLTGRTGAARNYILVSDEDRDVTATGTYAGLNYANTLSSLTASNILLNVIVDQQFRCDGVAALGVSKNKAGNIVGYKADGSGGYSLCTGDPTFSTGFGTTKTDYVDLALATGGAAWDLDILRAGGTGAQSFTKAFIDIKVQEIQEQQPQPTPEPGILGLLGIGLLGLVYMRRKTA